jgi:hypothetical protein
MNICSYCNLGFIDKKKLTIHQKTKKCLVHRHIGFTCQKCFAAVTGYDNIVQHVQHCDATETLATVIVSVVDLLQRYDLEAVVVFDSCDNGTIHFKQVCKYVHSVSNTTDTSSKMCKLLKRPALWMKAAEKYVRCEFYNYINDVFNNMLRLSDTFQILVFKHPWIEVFRKLWVDTPTPCVIQVDQDFYILSKVQCRNSHGQKWFGDTTLLNEDETVFRRVWTKDPGLKNFSLLLQSLLKDALNLFLILGNWILKKKKIKFKKSTNPVDGLALIDASLHEFGLGNLVENIKTLDDYDRWFEGTRHLIPTSLCKYANVEDVFESEGAFGIAAISLMNMNNPELTGSNYDHLMHYVLQECEKHIFLSKLH